MLGSRGKKVSTFAIAIHCLGGHSLSVEHEIIEYSCVYMNDDVEAKQSHNILHVGLGQNLTACGSLFYRTRGVDTTP
mgnify:CR=1 FL=1